MSIRRYLETLLGLLYPQERPCLSCGGPIPETSPGRREGLFWQEKGLCAGCENQLLPMEPPYCLLCGRQILQPGRCPECERETAFVLSRSYGKYEGVLRELLHRFKFSREEDLLTVLGPCLTAAWDLHMAHFSIDVLVPVPAHEQRLKERGYNQAERLARHLASYANIPCIPALQRHLHLKGQATRDRNERLKALQGAFSLNADWQGHISGKRVLLVDDIYTTGSTAEACSGMLREAGAAQVYMLTVAR